MTIRTTAGSTVTYTVSGAITGGTLIRYTIDGNHTTVSIVTTDTVAILALLNSLNLGDWTYASGIYTCVNFLKSLIGFRVDTGGGTNDFTFLGVENSYLVDYDNNGMAVELETVTAVLPVQPTHLNYGVCPCTCEFEELVLAGSTDSDLYRSDRSSFWFRKFDSGDSFTLKLIKNGTTEITIDNTIAEVFDFGDLKRNGVVDDQYAGFIIHWYLVFGANSYGTYQIVGTQIIAGVEYKYVSHKFNLRAFNYKLALGTIKVEVTQNGYNESEAFDFTGLNLYQAVRVRGKLTKGLPKYTEENYIREGRTIEQIQALIVDEYQLELRPLPAEIANFIAYNTTLSNKILVSDYNVNPEVYQQLDLRIKQIDEFRTWAQNTNIKGTFKLEPRLQNNLKRNFK